MTLHLKFVNHEVKRERNRGHWFLRDKPRGQWYPEAVGIVPAYPRTYEEYLTRQRVGIQNIKGQTRAGTRTGTGGRNTRRLELKQLKRAGRQRAERIMEEIKKRVEFADYRGEMAMQAAVEIMETRDVDGKRLHSPKDVLAAARMICDFTQSRPVTKQEHTIRSAEEWLASLDAGE